jgi:hypothetical protein
MATGHGHRRPSEAITAFDPDVRCAAGRRDGHDGMAATVTWLRPRLRSEAYGGSWRRRTDYSEDMACISYIALEVPPGSGASVEGRASLSFGRRFLEASNGAGASGRPWPRVASLLGSAAKLTPKHAGGPLPCVNSRTRLCAQYPRWIIYNWGSSWQPGSALFPLDLVHRIRRPRPLHLDRQHAFSDPGCGSPGGDATCSPPCCSLGYDLSAMSLQRSTSLTSFRI